MNVGQYFNLSEPVFTESAAEATAPPAAPPAVTVAGGAAAAPAPAPPPAEPASQPLSWVWQAVIYATVLVSILASRFLDLYRAGVPGEFQLDLHYLASIGIISLLVFPAAYDRARLHRNEPVLVQLGFIFAAGMGWEKIVATAVGK